MHSDKIGHVYLWYLLLTAYGGLEVGSMEDIHVALSVLNLPCGLTHSWWTSFSFYRLGFTFDNIEYHTYMWSCMLAASCCWLYRVAMCRAHIDPTVYTCCGQNSMKKRNLSIQRLLVQRGVRPRASLRLLARSSTFIARSR